MQRAMKGMAAVLVTVMVFGGLVRADVMQQVPPQALVVVRMNNMEQTSARIAEMANRMQLAQFAPALADPLGTLMRDIGINQGVRRDGQAAIVILPDELVEGFDDAFLLLIPVTNYQQFLQNFEQQEGGGEIRQVRMPDREEPGFVTQRGEYAAMAPSRQLLELEGRGMNLPQVTRREADAADVAIVMNMAGIRERAVPALQMGRAMAIAQLDAQAQRDPQAARMVQLFRVAIEQAISLIETGFNDAEGAVIGLRLTDDGVNSTMLAEFRQDTQFGRAVAGLRNTDEELLRGLPEGRYLMFGGSVQDPDAAAALLEQLTAPMRGQIEAAGEPGRAVLQYIDAIKLAASAQTGQTFGMIAPTGVLMQESIFQTVTISRGDADAMRNALQRVFETQQELMRTITGGQGQATTTFTANATTIADVPLDRFQTDLAIDPQTPQAAQAQQAIVILYGPDGINGYTGKVADDRLIVLMGPREPALERYITAAKADEAPMAQRVAAVSAHLPKQRAAVLYLPLDVMVSTAANYARAFGMPLPLQLPPNLPPIGISVASEGAAVRIDSHIPARLIESLTAAAMQLQMQMQGDPIGDDPGAL